MQREFPARRPATFPDGGTIGFLREAPGNPPPEFFSKAEV